VGTIIKVCCSHTPVTDDPPEVFKVDWLLHCKMRLYRGMLTKGVEFEGHDSVLRVELGLGHG
jgi:hypothetical protein